MQFLRWMSGLDTVSRFSVAVIAALLTYILVVCFAFPLATGVDFDTYIFSFDNPQNSHTNVLSIFAALLVSAVLLVLTRPRECSERKELMENLLSDDEKKVIAIVEETGEITQDSLTFRLGWSRPKISTILTGLERRNTLQRKREGKTYVVLPVKRKHH